MASRVLHPKSAVPDSATFIKASTIRHLSHSLKSPYKTLNAHPAVTKHSNACLDASFRYQSTPCSQPPEIACFEFASSFWEDKKPVHELLEHAYRQNRMATAAAARMLYSLQIEACVFGLVWADGTVRAHVDWCSGQRGYPVRDRPLPLCLGLSLIQIVFSAPYPGPGGDTGPVFNEWELGRPSDILKVYFLLRNLDIWTSTQFRERVTTGVEAFCKAVTQEDQAYRPWKRANDTPHARVLQTVTEAKENVINVTGGSCGPKGRKGRRV